MAGNLRPAAVTTFTRTKGGRFVDVASGARALTNGMEPGALAAMKTAGAHVGQGLAADAALTATLAAVGGKGGKANSKADQANSKAGKADGRADKATQPLERPQPKVLIE